MTDYLSQAREQKITLAEAYIKTQNKIIKLAAVQSPSPTDFKESEQLQKQLRDITAAITEETIMNQGFQRNPKTYLWEKTKRSPNTTTRAQ